MPVVPLPMNGSSTMPPSGQPAKDRSQPASEGGGIVTALEGNGVDLPDIAFVAKRIDVTILDLAMLTGAVDGLAEADRERAFRICCHPSCRA